MSSSNWIGAPRSLRSAARVRVCAPIALAAILAGARTARAAGPTPGYPEAVIQWGVQKGESCDDIAKVVYGSPKHVGLLHRYNRITCGKGKSLPEGLTLVLPAEVTTVPDAKIRSMHPDVRARPSGGAWGPASTGMPLLTGANVNTLDAGRADVEFVDRTRVFLAPNTLVVIYGTASRTRVSKTQPAAVEVQSGEVKAALAALRGQTVEVAVPGGGQVSAASRHTVVQRKGNRTTVAVFDGKAGVKSGGKSVVVPKDHGTRFVGTAPPAPPRPLPPAPAWETDGAVIALAPGSVGTVTAAWKPAPGAVSYRIELARDPEMNDLIVREEVSSNLRSFRGEKLPVGAYTLRVRAIDKEDYLGVGADRALHVVGVDVDGGGRVGPREITASPYATLRLKAPAGLEMAIDDGPFGPVVDRFDLKVRAPRELKLRPRGSAVATSIPVRYEKVEARIEADVAQRGAPAAGGSTNAAPPVLNVRVHLDGLAGIDVPHRVAPRVRVQIPGEPEVRTAPLVAGEGGVLAASLPLAAPLPSIATRIDVVDDRGGVLGTLNTNLSGAPPPPDAPRPRRAPRLPVIGAWVPFLSQSPVTDTLWLPPTLPPSVAVGAAMSPADTGLAAQGQVRATGGFGPISIDGALRTGAAGNGAASPEGAGIAPGLGGSGWLGARARVLRLGRTEFELAPVFRVGFPLAASGPPTRIEPSFAAGGLLGRVSWLIDLGARVRVEDDEGAAGTPPAQGFLLAGASLEPNAWVRLHIAADAHLVHRDTGEDDVAGGIAAGVEAGTAVFGALSLHAGPPPEAREGAFAAQLAVGVRERTR